jgi:hypothetical protein
MIEKLRYASMEDTQSGLQSAMFSRVLQFLVFAYRVVSRCCFGLLRSEIGWVKRTDAQD